MDRKSESWFHYWNHPVRSWKSLLATHNGSMVMVPINWAFHCEDGEFGDFGEARPETDLARLATWCESLGKEILFLLPLTPLPIFADGGVPRLLARSLAQGPTGLNRTYADREGKISRFYSFFDQRVFQGFQKYAWKLGRHFTLNTMEAPVMGLLGGSMEQAVNGTCFNTYLEDSSPAFDQGFRRFITKNSAHEKSFDHVDQEREAKHLYREMIQEVYLETAKESLKDYWKGAVNLSFLGGGSEDLFLRTCSAPRPLTEYVRSFDLALTHNKLPCMALLPETARSVGLQRFFSLALPPSLVKSGLGSGMDEDEASPQYHPLRFFALYQRPGWSGGHGTTWEAMGLKSYLQHHYPGVHMVGDLFGPEARDFAGESAHCLLGSEVDLAVFTDLLRAFLDGTSFVLDLSGVDQQVSMRLESFILENSLEVEVVKCQMEM